MAFVDENEKNILKFISEKNSNVDNPYFEFEEQDNSLRIRVRDHVSGEDVPFVTVLFDQEGFCFYVIKESLGRKEFYNVPLAWRDEASSVKTMFRNYIDSNNERYYHPPSSLPARIYNKLQENLSSPGGQRYLGISPEYEEKEKKAFKKLKGKDLSISYKVQDYFYPVEKVDAFSWEELSLHVRKSCIYDWELRLKDNLENITDEDGRHNDIKIEKGTFLAKKSVINRQLFPFWKKLVKDRDSLEKIASKKAFATLGRVPEDLSKFFKLYPERVEWLTRDSNRWMFYMIEWNLHFLDNHDFNVAYEHPVLRRSLSNVPRSLPPGLIFDIIRFQNLIGLREALPKNRKIWILFSLLADLAAHRHNGKGELVYNAYLRTEDPLKFFYKNAKEKMGLSSIGRSTSYISSVWNNMLDFHVEDVGRNATLSAIYDASVLYHEENREQRRRRFSDLDPEDEVAVPEAPLPDISGMTFLSIVREIWDEGEEMGHCVGSYARRAKKGSCFLFHYENEEGEKATTEVDPYGKVRQSYGPGDTINSASKESKRLLEGWASKYPHCWERKNSGINISGPLACEEADQRNNDGTDAGDLFVRPAEGTDALPAFLR